MEQPMRRSRTPDDAGRGRRGAGRVSWRALLVPVLLAVSGCSNQAGEPASPAGGSASAGASASVGQVSPSAPASPHGITHYAASRFLEQASFGPTPSSIAEVKRLGFSAWIDAQLALPASRIDPAPLTFIDPGRFNVFGFEYPSRHFSALALKAPEQLRIRVAWSLSQFLVVSQKKIPSYGIVEYMNFLMQQAFADYGPLLRAMTVHPAMGHYLDNGENKAAEACIGCAPNENYARELLQLFALGVVRLNEDGTLVRDAQGRTIETYTQEDVQELARVLTGWSFDYHDVPPPGDPFNYSRVMLPRRGADHDQGGKVVLGSRFPAGQSIQQDLDQAIAVLMAHPNVAPFVSQRLIQHLVMSDPSPAYVKRVARVFANDGTGRRGHLAAVVKAVLLDPDARAGDQPVASPAAGGKLREPFLQFISRWRGLGCRELARQPGSEFQVMSFRQQPFNAPSVFSFYLPTDRAPGSLLLAPEQATLNGQELRGRLGEFTHHVVQGYDHVVSAGCNLTELEDAFAQSEDRFLDLVSTRWFRGALGPTERAAARRLSAASPWMNPRERMMSMLSYLLATPAFGVMR